MVQTDLQSPVIIVLKRKQQFGPFDLTQLENYVKSGDFLLTDYCWTNGWSEWKMIAHIVSRLPESAKNENPNPVSSGNPTIRTENSKVDSSQKSTPHPNSDSSKRSIQPINAKSSAIDCNKLTNMAMFGFVGPKSANPEPPHGSILSGTVMIHLARKSQIIDYCAASEIPRKLQDGLIQPSDWWFNEKSGQWEPVYELDQILAISG